MKIHLVDGTYELFRHFYAAPSRVGADGREVGAVRGLLRSLLALLAEDGVSHVAVAFDHVIESFRNALYPGYKTGDGIDPQLYAQFVPAEEACRALGVVTWAMTDFEADDAIATAAGKFSLDADVEQIVICSPDKDLAQCIRDGRVVCLDRMRRRVLDEDGVIEKFGVGPASIPDWLALVGDAADGLPGIAGWGAKSTAAILGAYGTLERIPANEADWSVKVRGAARLASALRERFEDALLFRRLATLRADVPLQEKIADLRWRGPSAAALAAIGANAGDAGLLERAEALASAR
ncbi:MAG: flap endonuclease [Gammaproteobacteria bacterium]|nr:flap endonuclease [Gammaproteobacteria bacterium]